MTRSKEFLTKSSPLGTLCRCGEYIFIENWNNLNGISTVT
jgi:hypothetical protein